MGEPLACRACARQWAARLLACGRWKPHPAGVGCRGSGAGFGAGARGGGDGGAPETGGDSAAAAQHPQRGAAAVTSSTRRGPLKFCYEW
ncbi:unnamed protein product [Caretta caretta]